MHHGSRAHHHRRMRQNGRLPSGPRAPSRDLLPLPRLCAQRVAAATSLPRSSSRCGRVRRRANALVDSINRLGSAQCRSSTPTSCSAPPTAPQDAVQQRFAQAVVSYGEPSGWTPSTAFESTIKSKDLYSLDTTSVRPYDRDKLRILREGVTPSPLRPRLPDDACFHLDSLWSAIVRPESEMEILFESGEASGVTPYWDAHLRHDRDARISIFKELAQVGLVGFQTEFYCRAALFFVDKKGSAIRMIVDGREASQHCHRPPYSPLGSAGAWAEMDMSDATMQRNGLDPALPPFGASADLRDGFHQFVDRSLGGLFGFDFAELAEVYDCTHVWDNRLQQLVAVTGDTRVFPVYIGLPMGWSWIYTFARGVSPTACASEYNAWDWSPSFLKRRRWRQR